MTMDRRQKKNKKREEKLKQKKLREQKAREQGVTESEKTSGRLQLIVFFAVAVVGAALIIIMNT